MPTPPTHSASPLSRLVNGEQVFSPNPQVSQYFPAAAIEDARRRLKRAIERGEGPAVVVGAAGTGKSLLLQALAAQYHKRFDVVLLACTRICTRRALLQTILFELGLPYRQRDEGQLRLRLLDHLLSDKQSPAGLLLLVDEAQALSISLLDELRVMTNLMRGGSPRVRLLLAGSPALEESFAHPELESLSQRLSARCYLSPWSRDETCQYVRSQIATAGATPEEVFADDVFDAIFEATDGVPRLVNQVCDRALLMAGDEGRAIVDRRVVQAAWADLQQLPTAWNSSCGTNTALGQPSQVIEFGSLEDTLSASDELAVIDPTEIDTDDEEYQLDRTAESGSCQLGNETTARGNRERPTGRATHDPVDPFGEAFDEEEVVLDNFATWEGMFSSRTPRVENHRDRSFTTLIESTLAIRQADERAHEPRIGQENSFISDDLVAPTDGAEEDTSTDDAPPARPRLRLAIVPDSLASDSLSAEPEAFTVVPASCTWKDSNSGRDNPILIVDDESPAVNSSGSPVRRLAYQHLFSRLRSG